MDGEIVSGPRQPPVPVGARSKRLALLGLLLLSTAILFCRKPSAFISPQFWAEDGTLFFTEARSLGLESLVKAYRGSQYFLQRVVAYFGTYLPVRYVPHFYNYAALAAILGTIAYIACSRCRLPAKWLMCLVVVCCPQGGEVYMNLTNVHWILALIPLVVLVSEDPQKRYVVILELSMLAALFLTGPFVVIYLPLMLARLWINRSGYSLALVVVALICAGVHLSHWEADRAAGRVDLLDPHWAGFLGNSVAGSLFFGKVFQTRFPNNFGLVVFSAVTFVGLLVQSWMARDSKRLMFLTAAGLMIAATAYSYRGGPEAIATPGLRYMFVPLVCLIWSLILAAGSAQRFKGGWCALLILVGVASASQFRALPLKDFHWQAACRWIDGPIACRIPINPDGWAIYYSPDAARKLHGVDMQTRDLPLEVAGPSEMVRLNGSGQDSRLVYDLDKPLFIDAVVITYTLNTPHHDTANFAMVWKKKGKSKFADHCHSYRCQLEPNQTPQQMVIWVFDSLDQIRIDPGEMPGTFRPRQIQLVY